MKRYDDRDDSDSPSDSDRFGNPVLNDSQMKCFQYFFNDSCVTLPFMNLEFLDRVRRTHVLGEGGFGAVYLCHRRNKPGRKETCV